MFQKHLLQVLTTLKVKAFNCKQFPMLLEHRYQPSPWLILHNHLSSTTKAWKRIECQSTFCCCVLLWLCYGVHARLSTVLATTLLSVNFNDHQASRIVFFSDAVAQETNSMEFRLRKESGKVSRIASWLICDALSLPNWTWQSSLHAAPHNNKVSFKLPLIAKSVCLRYCNVDHP